MPPKVPDDDQPVTIDLNAPDAPGQQSDQQQQAKTSGPPYVDRVPLDPLPETKRELPEDEGPDLEYQLREMQKREKAANDRAALERNQRLASEQRSQQQVSQTAAEKETSDYYSVTNALAAKTGELNNAKAEYANAIASGDHAQATEINDRMIDLRIDIRDLSSGKADFEQKFEQRRRQPQQPQQRLQQPPDIETVLASMPNLLESEKQWARKHPDVVFDASQYKQLEAAYLAWEKTGQPRGTPEYFKFFNERLGYTDDQGDGYDDAGAVRPMAPPTVPQQPSRGPAASAPVSRSAPGASSRQAAGGGGGNQITLSPQQREAARFSGIDEKTYARNVQRLNDLKRRGYYQETG